MQTTSTVRAQPLLIYDGDCGFCVYWVRYWRGLTGNRVTYAPYQEVAAQYPEIPLDAFQRAVQYVAPDGKIASGAEAALLTLSHAPGKALLADALSASSRFCGNRRVHLRICRFAPFRFLSSEPVAMGARL